MPVVTTPWKPRFMPLLYAPGAGRAGRIRTSPRGLDPAALEHGVEGRERLPRVVAEVHGLHTDGPRRGHVVVVVVEEHRRGGVDAQPFAREPVDPLVRLAHPDRARVDHHLEQLVDGEGGSPGVAELLHVVGQQRERQAVASELADPVHHRPVAVSYTHLRAHETDSYLV